MIPPPETTTRKLTFAVPHILKSIDVDQNGFTDRLVREGGSRQIDFETVVGFSETPVENEPTFVVRVTNQLNFAGSIINVINDETLLENGFRLVPTVPTASEYFALIGSRLQVNLSCVLLPPQAMPQWWEDKTKPLYKVARVFIVSLP